MLEPRVPTTIGGYLLAITRALAARGVDVDALLARSGVPQLPTSNPLDRVTVTSIARVLAEAGRSTGDPLIGLEIAKYMRPTMLHALGMSLEVSRDLRDFGLRLARFYRFVSHSAALSFVERESHVAIETTRIDARVPYESEDATAGFIARLVTDLSAERIRPQSVSLRRALPADGGARHREFFGCPVDFGRESLAIRFDKALVEVPFLHASAELAQHNDQIVLEYLERLDRNDLETRVKSLVIRDLPTGAVTKTRIAKKMHMSARTLQHKLAQRNTNFHTLVDETRLALARRYIENSSMSIREIAYLLGFSEASNFSRAYKRWTGRAPRERRPNVS